MCDLRSSLDYSNGPAAAAIELHGKYIELDAVGHQFEPYLTGHAGGALVV